MIEMPVECRENTLTPGEMACQNTPSEIDMSETIRVEKSELKREHQINRTLLIIGELAKGKVLKIHEGYIGMNKNMQIGIVSCQTGDTILDVHSRMDLEDLNHRLNINEIGFPVRVQINPFS